MSGVNTINLEGSGRRGGSDQGAGQVSRSSSLTLPGFLFVFVAVFLALGAINGQNNLLFWLFGFAIASLVLSGIVTGNALMSLRLVAHGLTDAEALAPHEVRYTLVNTSRVFPNFAIEIEELGSGDSNPARRTKRHAKRSGAWFEIHNPGVVLHVPPSADATGAATLVFRERGRHTLGRVNIRTRFPFGLFEKSIMFDTPRRVLVYPSRVEITRDPLGGARARDAHSLRHLAKRGSGLEYFGVREYQPGDPLRSVAWKVSARRGALHVSEYPDPVSASYTIELQRPPDSVSAAQFEHAVRVLYSIALRSTAQRLIGVSVPWAAVRVPPGSGEAHARRVGRALAVLDRDAATEQAGRDKDVLVLGYSRAAPGPGGPRVLFADELAADMIGGGV